MVPACEDSQSEVPRLGHPPRSLTAELATHAMASEISVVGARYESEARQQAAYHVAIQIHGMPKH